MKFDSYHPAINFIFFISVLFFSFYFTQPVFIAISFFAALIYSIKCGKTKAVVLDVVLILFALIYTLYYSYYNHFGVTNLMVNIIGNQITLESVFMGFVRGIHIATAAMWFYCMTKVISTDKIIYMTGRVSPKLSLFISITLRSVPQFVQRFRTVNRAQCSIGRGFNQGNIFVRIKNSFRVLSIVITQTLESFVEISNSMKSRGYSLKGRTAFSVYRFDNRDRSVVILMFFGLIVTFMGIALNQGKMQINPEIILNPITSISYLIYFIYFLFSVLPVILEMIADYKSQYK